MANTPAPEAPAKVAAAPAPEAPAKVAAAPAPEAPVKVAAAPAPAGPGKLTLSNPGSKTAVKTRDNSKAPLPVGTSGKLYVVHN